MKLVRIKSSKSNEDILVKIKKICKKLSDKVVDVDYAYKGYTQTKECVLVELSSEDEYEARKIEYNLEDLPEVSSASVVDYYEISEDSYDDLDPDIRDTKVIKVWLNKEEQFHENNQSYFFQKSYFRI